MSGQGNEKLKIRKLIAKIESGIFDENDIDNLFLHLRAFCFGSHIFREIADFVAHNSTRDQGVTLLSLDNFYLFLRFYCAYGFKNKSFDISLPFPEYIKRLMIYQIDRCDPIKLLNEFKVSQSGLKSRINSLFKKDANNPEMVYRVKNISRDMYDVFSYLLSTLHIKPVFIQDDVINEIILVIRKNNIVFDDIKIRAHSDKIILCIMLLLNNSKFDFKGYRNGYCKIAQTGDNDLIGDMGYLRLEGQVTVPIDEREVEVRYPLFTTNLKVKDWCHESLYTLETIEVDGVQTQYFKLDLRSELCMNAESKLVRICD